MLLVHWVFLKRERKKNYLFTAKPPSVSKNGRKLSLNHLHLPLNASELVFYTSQELLSNKIKMLV